MSTKQPTSGSDDQKNANNLDPAYQKFRFRQLTRYLQLAGSGKKDCRVLLPCCNSPADAEVLQKLLPEFSFSATCTSPEILQSISAKGLEDVKLWQNDAIPYEDGEFDLICFLGAEENLPFSNGFLFQELSRVLTLKGLFYINIPAMDNIHTVSPIGEFLEESVRAIITGLNQDTETEKGSLKIKPKLDHEHLVDYLTNLGLRLKHHGKYGNLTQWAKGFSKGFKMALFFDEAFTEKSHSLFPVSDLPPANTVGDNYFAILEKVRDRGVFGWGDDKKLIIPDFGDTDKGSTKFLPCSNESVKAANSSPDFIPQGNCLIPRCSPWDMFQRQLNWISELIDPRGLSIVETNSSNLSQYDSTLDVISYQADRYLAGDLNSFLVHQNNKDIWSHCQNIIIPLANSNGTGYDELFKFALVNKNKKAYVLTPSLELKSLDDFIRKGKHTAVAQNILIRDKGKMRKFENIHAGQRCFIIGNGPSLNEMNLAPLKDEYTFGVNAIYLNKDKMGFLPTYYTVEDQFVAEDRSEEIMALRGPTKFYPADLGFCLKPDDTSIYYTFKRKYRSFPQFSCDASDKVCWGGTVTIACLQLAYYMGFSEVYLIGVDFSYAIPKYAKGPNITSQEDDVNHFNKDYFGKGYRWHHPRLDRALLAFELANASFLADDRQVFNATMGGKLEVFQRADYNKLFAAKK